MTILSVAFPLLPVSADASGGAEQILYLLDRELIGAGFRSIVIAAKGSDVSGLLLETGAAPGEITDAVQREAQQVHQRHILAAIDQYNVDLIHFHGLDFDAYRPTREEPPQLATLHLPLAWYNSRIFETPSLHLNCVSISQAGSAPSGLAPPVITNGIDVERFEMPVLKQDYSLWLGRICPEKGVAIALRLAHRLNLELRIAGPVHPYLYHRNYFRSEIEPLLDDKRRYLGYIDGAAKKRLLAHASCLLVPSIAPETSSLVAMEAISSGTPVIGFRSGALPEVVDHGVTGFIVDTEEEMAGAIVEAKSLSPLECRSVAQKRFQAVRMAGEYMDLYRSILLR